MSTCTNCGGYRKWSTPGLCKACQRYQHKTGKVRPYRGDGRTLNPPRGEAHYAWKGDAARTQTKRERAQKMYQLGTCEMCDKPATDRHHKDGNTGNNDRTNIALLCRRCHMQVDGRLARLAATISIPPQPPKLCSNCGRLYKPLRNGMCHACNEYQRRNGVPRPAKLYSEAS